MKNYLVLLAYFCVSTLFSTPIYAADESKDIAATTPQGDQVVLHPNGRWEFTDTKKAAVAKEVASQYTENQGCPHGTQGGFLGFGRCITAIDKDFNRGSMGGKGR
ncbi:MAG: hypothetical protein H0W85_01730 [Methylotenera sp.]|nr:hypothetical protein [Methylotenera sp.]